MGTWLSDRALIRIAGDDPRDFLQGLVTSDMRGPLPVWAGLLSPQGKALFDFIVWPDGEAVLIDCEASAAEALARRLAMYRLRRPITIEAMPGGVHWAPEGDEGVPDPRLPQPLGPTSAPGQARKRGQEPFSSQPSPRRLSETSDLSTATGAYIGPPCPKP